MLQVMFVIIKEWKSFADADTSQLFFDLFYMFLLTLTIKYCQRMTIDQNLYSMFSCFSWEEERKEG